MGTLSQWYYPVPRMKCKLGDALIRETNREWEERWQAHVPCRQTRLFLPKLNPKMGKSLLGLPRSELGLMMQVLTGHAHLNYHLSKQNRSRNSKCRKCRKCDEEDESAWHLYKDCPAFETLRLQYLYTEDEDRDIDPAGLYTFCQSTIFPMLIHPDAR